MKKRIPVRIIKENKERLLEKDGEKYISVDDLIKSLGAVDARPKKQKNKVEDLDDLIRQFEDDYPEEIKMLDRTLQDVPDSSEVVPLNPELLALINKDDGDVSPEVDQMLAALDKSDAEKAAKEKAEKARQAAIKLLVDNPQAPVELSVEDPNNIHDAIKTWDPFPGLLPQDTPPEAKKMRTESLQGLMSKLKLIFEAQVRKSVEDVDKRFESFYSKGAFDHWVKNGRKLYDHWIPFSIGARTGEAPSRRFKRSVKVGGKLVPAREIKAGKLSFMQSYGLAPLILHGFRREFSLVRGDRFGPKNISATSRSPGASPALTAMVAYNYFQAVYPDMALKESLISNFNKESDKHFIGRAQRVGKDGSIPYRRGHFTTRSHNPREWKQKNKWDKRPATATPITFEELQKTMDDWKSNFKKFSSTEYIKPDMGYRESEEMLSVRHSQKISAEFKDPREPYKPPEAKAKKKTADGNPDPGSVDIGGMLKYYMSIIDQADDITGGAIKRNVYMGDKPYTGEKPFTGSEPKPRPPRIQQESKKMNKETLIQIIKEETNKVLSERPFRSRRAAAAFDDLDAELANAGPGGTSDIAATPSVKPEPKAQPKPKLKPKSKPKPQTKCQGAKYTKECAIAFLKEYIPLSKLPSNRKNAALRSDAFFRHRIANQGFKRVTHNTTGAKGYRVNGIIVMDTEIQ